MKKIALLILVIFSIASCKKDNAKMTPIISFVANAKTIGDPVYTLPPPLSTGIGAFTYTSSNPAVATISGDQVTIVGVGNTTITATQAADDNYEGATVSANLQVVPVGTFVTGQSYQGGIIFYINGTGQHGFMVSPADLSTSVPWVPTVTSLAPTNATSFAIGSGAANTAKIFNILGNTGTYAAKLCTDYRGGGFSDWFLPSIAELAFVRYNKDLIGGISNTDYWTSNEIAASPTAPNALYLSMALPLGTAFLGTASNGTVIAIQGTTSASTVTYYTFSKAYTFSVRAVRAF
ncbi:hypothetical protein KXQ82_08410 [Mucilaginibacter sp. HMF5004]|uniref:hypothetical protein n=1 Tax=Mucilaginibacter rivuli TaxID=2857527 RepID=UPI001C5E63A5|nr:hypothetical protein [Mucilaginibacter rivuli]MBW4889736.1 hypothetical protein [Mucilaginibacter rivuli]